MQRRTAFTKVGTGVAVWFGDWQTMPTPDKLFDITDRNLGNTKLGFGASEQSDTFVPHVDGGRHRRKRQPLHDVPSPTGLRPYHPRMGTTVNIGSRKPTATAGSNNLSLSGGPALWGGLTKTMPGKVSARRTKQAERGDEGRQDPSRYTING